MNRRPYKTPSICQTCVNHIVWFGMRISLLLAVIILVGAGCAQDADRVSVETMLDKRTSEASISAVEAPIEEVQVEGTLLMQDVVFPVDRFVNGRTYLAFGEYVKNRFSGYHLGDDIEYTDTTAPVPVRAIAEGEVVYKRNVGGYGGLIIVEHTMPDEEVVRALYGHVDIDTSSFEEGDKVSAGEELAILGEHESEDTDGERKHLHFALYKSSAIWLPGYSESLATVKNWINPQDFFERHGLLSTPASRLFDPAREIGGEDFGLYFKIPAGWEVEYVPGLRALNIFSLAGDGSARERSGILITFQDQVNFGLPYAFEVLQSKDASILGVDVEAKNYNVDLRRGYFLSSAEPAWRRAGHVITQIRRGDGGSERYYNIAVSPNLDLALYSKLLQSIEIIEK